MSIVVCGENMALDKNYIIFIDKKLPLPYLNPCSEARVRCYLCISSFAVGKLINAKTAVDMAFRKKLAWADDYRTFVV